MDKIGALWQKKDRRGSTMFSGEVECPHCKNKTRLFGFINKYKKPENRQPNFNLFMPDGEPQEPPQEPEVKQAAPEEEDEELPW